MICTDPTPDLSSVMSLLGGSGSGSGASTTVAVIPEAVTGFAYAAVIELGIAAEFLIVVKVMGVARVVCTAAVLTCCPVIASGAME